MTSLYFIWKITLGRRGTVVVDWPIILSRWGTGLDMSIAIKKIFSNCLLFIMRKRLYSLSLFFSRKTCFKKWWKLATVDKKLKKNKIAAILFCSSFLISKKNIVVNPPLWWLRGKGQQLKCGLSPRAKICSKSYFGSTRGNTTYRNIMKNEVRIKWIYFWVSQRLETAVVFF